MTGGRVLLVEMMKQIVAKTDGNPLFVEELTKTVLESGILVENGVGYRLEGPLPPLAIPATLQDSLMARLDRLAPVKEIAPKSVPPSGATSPIPCSARWSEATSPH